MAITRGHVTFTMRWLSLLLLCIANGAGYYVYDSIAPVAGLFHDQLGFSFGQIGALNAVYSLPNIGLALVGGVLADRFGASRVAALSTGICFIGSALMAVGSNFYVMLSGRFLFGVGGETSLVAMLACVAAHFRIAHLAIAFALFFSTARLGSYAADIMPALAARIFSTWQPPLILSTAIAALSHLAATANWMISPANSHPSDGQAVARHQRWPTRAEVLPQFWLLAVVGALFYAVVFPFRSTFSIDFFEHTRGLTLADAGIANSWMFLAALIGTPLFAVVAERANVHKELLLFGLTMLLGSFLVLFFRSNPLWVTSALIGIGYSVVPSVLWPAAAAVVVPARQGFAFGAMTVLQNVGMTVSNFVAGHLNDYGGASAAHPSGYLPMLTWFALLSAGGLVLSIRVPNSTGRSLDVPVS